VSDSIQEKKQIQPTVEFKIGSETGQYPSRLSLARLIGAPFNVSLSGPNAKPGACGPGATKTRAGLGKD
jgi:hypothetical protein